MKIKSKFRSVSIGEERERSKSSAMSGDPKDDVDRLFACFKCGLSTPGELPCFAFPPFETLISPIQTLVNATIALYYSWFLSIWEMAESALKERRSIQKKPKRVSLERREQSSVAEATAASCDKQKDQDSAKSDKVRFYFYHC